MMFSVVFKFIFISFMTSTMLYANVQRYQQIISSSYANGSRYGVVNWVKEFFYYNQGSLGPVAGPIEDIVLITGVKNFTSLNEKMLSRNIGSTVDYILGRKYFDSRDYSKAIVAFSRVNRSSKFYPQAQYQLAVTYYLKRDWGNASLHFDNCQREASSMKNSSNDGNVNKQYKLTMDLCQVGKSRMLYTEKKYEAADLSYLDLDKKSIVWPQILSEEAWSSYYQANYNRTLGKLVTYKAPLLNYVVNPEQNILQAMSYMKMCLFKDVNKVVEDFYKENESDYRQIQAIVSRKQGSEYYYQMLIGASTESSDLLRNFLRGISKDPSISIYLDHIQAAEKERGTARSNLASYLNDNIDDFIDSQRKVVGLYVASKLQRLFYDLRSAFESMSYIKLEILGKRKKFVYQGIEFTGKRGDIKYLKRNEKQYFWDFNGEFWADELGDYVFALPSECPNDV